MRLRAEMDCPTCECKCGSTIFDTVSAKLTCGKVIRRQRVCRKCKQKFSTYEIPASEYLDFKTKQDKAMEISNAIAKVIELAERYKCDEEY